MASEDKLCYMLSRLWRDGVRGEGEKGVGSIPAIRCNVWIKRWAVKSGVLEKQCMWIWGSDDHNVIITKEGTKRTLKSCNTFFTISSISSCVHHERFAACV